MELNNQLINGNMFWIFEALKVVNKDFDFDKSYEDPINKNSKERDILIYECLVFNEDREDSLFVQQNGVLYEYFSNDKCELLLNLIKYYENKYYSKRSSIFNWPSMRDNRSNQTNKLPPISSGKTTALLNLISPCERKSNTIYPKQKCFQDVGARFRTEIIGNIYIVYRDNTSTWRKDYDLKKLLFYLKFIPRAKDIQLIRIFPPYVRSLKKSFQTHLDKEDQLLEKEDTLKMLYDDTSKEDKQIKNFIEKIKNIFYERYRLMLKRLDIQTFELDGKCYLLDVKDMVFEKFDSKHIKLACERRYFKYMEKYQHKKPEIKKDAPNILDIKNFYNAMNDKYDALTKAVIAEEYLKPPPRDKTSDEVFEILKPNCPYKFSKMMDNDIDKKTFVKYVTNNLSNVE